MARPGLVGMEGSCEDWRKFEKETSLQDIFPGGIFVKVV